MFLLRGNHVHKAINIHDNNDHKVQQVIVITGNVVRSRMLNLLPKVHRRIKLSTGFSRRGSKVRSRQRHFYANQPTRNSLADYANQKSLVRAGGKKKCRVSDSIGTVSLVFRRRLPLNSMRSLLFPVLKALIVARRATGNACRKFDKIEGKVMEKCTIVRRKRADRREN